MRVSVRFASSPDAAQAIIGHPEVFRWCADDLSAHDRLDVGRAVDERGVMVVEALDADDVVGVFLLMPMSGVMADVHVAFLPGRRGPVAKVAGDLMCDLVFRATPIQKLVAMAPANNRLAMALAASCGFSREGVLTKAFLRDGRLHDLVVYGLTKEQRCPQQQQS